MSQDRYRQIFEEKAIMNGGLRLGGNNYMEGGARPKKAKAKKNNVNKSGVCKRAETNPWVAHVKRQAKAHYNGNYAAALADPDTRKSYTPLSEKQKERRAKTRAAC